MNALCSPPPARPARWAVVLAFTLVYLAWGTTYLAISAGVKEFPPALFGGTRIGLAGLVLLGFLHWRGETLLLSRQGLLTAALIGNILFTGGNFLVTFGEKFVVSSSAAVLVATTPLWMALLETLAPRGERLQLRGWIGILLGLGGVLVMLSPKMRDPADLVRNFGPLLIIGSALSWAFGSFLTQRLPRGKSHLVAAAWQMVMGGAGQCLLGLFLGEPARLRSEQFTPQAVYAFFHLLVFGSLVGFVAYNWLLGHVPASQAGTYAYVNPVIAILVGWLLGGETITAPVVGGMIVILAGVALVRSQGAVVSDKWSVVSSKEPEVKKQQTRSETVAVDPLCTDNHSANASCPRPGLTD